MAGELAPAIGRNLAVLGIQGNDDVAAKSTAGVVQETRVLHGGRADDDKTDAAVDVTLDRVEVAQTTAQLDRYVGADRGNDLAHHRLVDRAAGAGAIQVDDVQAARPLRDPVPRYPDRVVGEHGLAFHVALAQPNAAPVFQVNGGDQKHGGLVRHQARPG